MFERVKRCDCEGMFRWHWVLIDSLEIFCDITPPPPPPQKKKKKPPPETHPEAFAYYKKSLQSFNIDSLEDWIVCVKNANKK